MSLEALLAPFKFVDEQVLRQYTKLTLTWEEKGHSRYSLTLGSTVAGVFLGYGLLHNPWETGHPHSDSPLPFSAKIIGSVFYLSYGLLTGFDIAQSFTHWRHGKKKGGVFNDVLPAPDTLERGIKVASRILRLPLLGFSALAGYALIRHITSDTPLSIDQTLSWAGILLYHAGHASSFYIKDTDQKILGRAPFWKRAYDFTRAQLGKLKDRLTPQPEPLPVPVEFYSSTP